MLNNFRVYHYLSADVYVDFFVVDAGVSDAFVNVAADADVHDDVDVDVDVDVEVSESVMTMTTHPSSWCTTIHCGASLASTQELTRLS